MKTVKGKPLVFLTPATKTGICGALGGNSDNDANCFMGFRFYRNRVTLRRKITLKAMRKARRIAKKRKTTVIDARQMLTYKGWTKVIDTYNWLQRYILCFVDFRKLRKIVSNYDKKRRALYVV